ncbi:hypothetical protein HDV01_006927 [Terramyces sp. JEL0728]|nr:hypothetical protein HDV01_006927 [Terramyces sp. JEL0728]
MEIQLQRELQVNQLRSFHVSTGLKTTLYFDSIVYEHVDFSIFKSLYNKEVILPFNLDIAIQRGYKIKEISQVSVTVYSDEIVPHLIDYEIQRDYLDLKYLLSAEISDTGSLTSEAGLSSFDEPETPVFDRETPSKIRSFAKPVFELPSKVSYESAYQLEATKAFRTSFEEYMLQGGKIVNKVPVSIFN